MNTAAVGVDADATAHSQTAAALADFCRSINNALVEARSGVDSSVDCGVARRCAAVIESTVACRTDISIGRLRAAN